MCPIPIAIGAIAAGTLVGAGASIYGGIQGNKAAKANAQIAEVNAEYSNRQAADAIDRGSDQVSQIYLQAGLLRGKQVTATAANGVEVGYGSAGQIISDTAALSEGDANTMRENASRAAEGYRIQAITGVQQADALRAQGSASLISGYLSAGGSLLGGAAQIAGIKQQQAQRSALGL